MNYFKIYNDVINISKTRVLTCYYEKHHIVPRCLGGDDSKNNLAVLTAREHFLCHYMLTKIYKTGINHKKMIKAFIMMKPCNEKQERYFNSRLYESKKLEFVEIQRESQTGLGNSQFGSMWVYNKDTLENKKIIASTYKDDGLWIKGRYGKTVKDKELKIQNMKNKKSKIYNTQMTEAFQLLELYKNSGCESLRDFCRKGFYDKTDVMLSVVLRRIPEYRSLSKRRYKLVL